VKSYATCIGSRRTPIEICNIMSLIGERLQNKYILRSGAAIGADQAFEKNVKPENKCIYTVKNFDYSQENYDLCYSELMSIWDKDLNFDLYEKYNQILLLRDINQVLGSKNTSLEKSKFLICYTPHENYNKRDVGGSRIAIRCALKHGIKVHNLVNPETLKMVKTWLNIV
jgi:hypothetical protein